MTKIQFDTSTISVPEIVDFFQEYMIVAKATPVKHDVIVLGALVFNPDGLMTTTVPLKNIVLQLILEDFRKAGHNYEIL
jgi:hypothetical protein